MSEKDGPEPSAGFSLFPKPRAHFLKPPFVTISPLGPGVPPGCCDGPTWVPSPAPPELWAAFPPGSQRLPAHLFLYIDDFPLHSQWGPVSPSGPWDPCGRIPSVWLSPLFLLPQPIPGETGFPRMDGAPQGRWGVPVEMGVPEEVGCPRGVVCSSWVFRPPESLL